MFHPSLRVSYTNMTGQVCSLLQEAAINALLGPSPVTHVATFGNTPPENTGDWVAIVPPVTETPEGATVSLYLIMFRLINDVKKN